MLNDFRYAARTLLRSPGFAVVAILTLALGIGANTAIFSVVNGVLLRPLPYPDGDRIVRLTSGTASDPQGSFSPPDFLDIDRDVKALSPIAGYRRDAVTIAVPGGEPQRVAAASVTADYFDVFAMPALLGRAFSDAADRGSTEPAVVVAEKVWERDLGGDRSIIGRRIKVNGVPHTVLGVMPRSFDYPQDNGVWVLSPMVVPTSPMNVPGDLLTQRDVHYFEVIGRLKPEAGLGSARAELDALAERQARDFPQSNQGRTIGVRQLDDVIVGAVRPALLMLLGAVGLVLLIACANVASLLLARASERQREIAVRSALGASRGHLMRQFLAESVLLGAVGGLVGLFAAAWAVAGLVSALPAGIPRADAIRLDLRVCGAAVLVALGSSLVFGLVPAWQGSRAVPSSVLHDAAGDRGSTGGRRRARTRAVFVVAEIALTLVLLVGAGLLVNSFLRLQRVDPGFQVDNLAVVTLPLAQSQYPDGPRQAQFYKRVLDGIRQRPGISSAAILFPGPFQSTNASGSFTIEGRSDATRANTPSAALASVSPGYFQTMGIPVVKGRDITEQDREPAPAVAMVNQALGRMYFPGVDPVGKRIRFGDTDEDWMTIVGIVADSRTRDLDEAPAPVLYIPYSFFTVPFMTVVARTDAGPGAVASAIREEVKAIDPEMPVDAVKPMREVIADRTAGPRFRTLLVGAFGMMALLLATVGVYGLVSYSVAQRTREFGIRMALGAHPRQVIVPVLKEGLALGVLGV
ncbi:MAG TPA: ABC transporter permease, partial [Vicinamibacterales bacterium]